MANYDLGTIGYTVESRGVASAKEEIRELGRHVNSAVNSASVFSQAFNKAFNTAFKEADRGAAEFRKVAKANQEVANSLLGVTNSYKSAKQSADVFTAALEKQEAAQRRVNLATAQRKAETAFALGVQRVGEESRQAAEVDRLRLKYDQLYATSRMYEGLLNEVNQAHAIGAISTQKHAAAVDALNLEYQQFQNGMATAGNRFSQYTTAVASRANQIGVVTQQAGYQIGDFLVQVQSGTNWMVAFGQQATQLVGVLPLMTGAFGLSTTALIGISTGLGIAIPLITALGAVWMRTSKDNDKATDSMKEAENQLKSLDKTLQDWLTTKKAASVGVTVEELLGITSIEDAQQKVDSLKETLDQLMTPTALAGVGAAGGIDLARLFGGDSVEDQIRNAEDNYRAALERLFTLQQKQAEEELKVINEKMAAYQEEVKLKEAIFKYGEDSAAVEKIRKEQAMASVDAWIKAEGVTGSFAKQIRDAAESAYDADRAVQGMSGGFDSASSSVANMNRLLGETVGKISGILSAIGRIGFDTIALRAEAAALKAGKSAGEARIEGEVALMQAKLGASGLPKPIAGFLGKIGGGALRAASLEQLRLQEEISGLNKTAAGSGVGGGGGGGSKADPLAELEQEIAARQKLIGLRGEERNLQEKITDLTDRFGEVVKDPAIIQSYAERLIALEALEEAEKKQLENLQSIADTLETSMSDAFTSMVDGTQTVSEAFKGMAKEIIKQLFDILVVQQIVGSWNATTGAGTGVVGMFMGGLTNNLAGSLSTGGTMRAGQPYLVGEKGPELVIPRHSGTVVNAHNTAAAGSAGPVTVQNVITVNGSDKDSVRREIQKMIPQITEATKASVINARQRGGAMKSAFQQQ